MPCGYPRDERHSTVEVSLRGPDRTRANSILYLPIRTASTLQHSQAKQSESDCIFCAVTRYAGLETTIVDDSGDSKFG